MNHYTALREMIRNNYGGRLVDVRDVTQVQRKRRVLDAFDPEV